MCFSITFVFLLISVFRYHYFRFVVFFQFNVVGYFHFAVHQIRLRLCMTLGHELRVQV